MTTRSRSLLALVAGLLTAVLSFAALSSAPVGAAEAPVDLGTAASYAVLGGSTVTNTGPSVVNGDLGLSPGTSVTNFPPGILNGTEHIADAEALQAKTDLVTAYNDAAGRTPETAVATELGGTTKLPGVYTGATLGITNTLTLDAQGDGTAVFIFKTPSTLITGTDSAVSLINGADPCNVFWQVAESATLGTRTAFQGTILALQSITATTGATVEGRLLARNAAVTLDTNVITAPTCDNPTTTTEGSTASSTTGGEHVVEYDGGVRRRRVRRRRPRRRVRRRHRRRRVRRRRPRRRVRRRRHTSSSTTEASTSSSTTEASTSSSTTEAFDVVEYDGGVHVVEYDGGVHVVEYDGGVHVVEYDGGVHVVEYDGGVHVVEYDGGVHVVEHDRGVDDLVEHQQHRGGGLHIELHHVGGLHLDDGRLQQQGRWSERSPHARGVRRFLGWTEDRPGDDIWCARSDRDVDRPHRSRWRHRPPPGPRDRRPRSAPDDEHPLSVDATRPRCSMRPGGAVARSGDLARRARRALLVERGRAACVVGLATRRCRPPTWVERAAPLALRAPH